MAQILVVAFSGQADTLSKLLTRGGHDVISASTSAEAIDLLTDYSPDLLLTGAAPRRL